MYTYIVRSGKELIRPYFNDIEHLNQIKTKIAGP